MCNLQSYSLLHLQFDAQGAAHGKEPYNAVDAMSLRHDICCRDNDTPAGKRGCDRKMLAELNILVPQDRLKHRIGMGVTNWSSQLVNFINQ